MRRKSGGLRPSLRGLLRMETSALRVSVRMLPAYPASTGVNVPITGMAVLLFSRVFGIEVGSQDNVLVHDHAQRPARAHGEGRCHGKVAFDEALSRAVTVLLRRLAQRLDETVIGGSERELAPHTQHGGERQA